MEKTVRADRPEQGKAEEYEISLNIQSEDMLFNAYDREHRTLNDGLREYLIDKLGQRGRNQRVVIHIYANDTIKEAEVKQAFSAMMEETQAKLRHEQKQNRIKQLWMLLIGAVFISLSLLLQSKVNMVVSEIISAIGAFSIWEAAGIWIIERPAIRHKKALLTQLGNTGLIVEQRAQ